MLVLGTFRFRLICKITRKFFNVRLVVRIAASTNLIVKPPAHERRIAVGRAARSWQQPARLGLWIKKLGLVAGIKYA
jgi:hypothetical protein